MTCSPSSRLRAALPGVVLAGPLWILAQPPPREWTDIWSLVGLGAPAALGTVAIASSIGWPKSARVRRAVLVAVALSVVALAVSVLRGWSDETSARAQSHEQLIFGILGDEVRPSVLLGWGGQLVGALLLAMVGSCPVGSRSAARTTLSTMIAVGGAAFAAFRWAAYPAQIAWVAGAVLLACLGNVVANADRTHRIAGAVAAFGVGTSSVGVATSRYAHELILGYADARRVSVILPPPTNGPFFDVLIASAMPMVVLALSAFVGRMRSLSDRRDSPHNRFVLAFGAGVLTLTIGAHAAKLRRLQIRSRSGVELLRSHRAQAEDFGAFPGSLDESGELRLVRPDTVTLLRPVELLGSPPTLVVTPEVTLAALFERVVERHFFVLARQDVPWRWRPSTAGAFDVSTLGLTASPRDLATVEVMREDDVTMPPHSPWCRADSTDSLVCVDERDRAIRLKFQPFSHAVKAIPLFAWVPAGAQRGSRVHVCAEVETNLGEVAAFVRSASLALPDADYMSSLALCRMPPVLRNTLANVHPRVTLTARLEEGQAEAGAYGVYIDLTQAISECWDVEVTATTVHVQLVLQGHEPVRSTLGAESSLAACLVDAWPTHPPVRAKLDLLLRPGDAPTDGAVDVPQ